MSGRMGGWAGGGGQAPDTPRKTAYSFAQLSCSAMETDPGKQAAEENVLDSVKGLAGVRGTQRQSWVYLS